ncbi:hypothetical protein LguiA_006681 [Lonicera macranthoides]
MVSLQQPHESFAFQVNATNETTINVSINEALGLVLQQSQQKTSTINAGSHSVPEEQLNNIPSSSIAATFNGEATETAINTPKAPNIASKSSTSHSNTSKSISSNRFASLNSNLWHDYVEEDPIQSSKAIADAQFEAAISKSSNINVCMSKAKQKKDEESSS